MMRKHSMATEQRDMASSPLAIGMSAAVPLRIMELTQIENITLRAEVMQRWAAEAEAVLGETGEAITHRTVAGDSARAFNAAAKGIAALAFVPGGITIFGMHFEAVMDGAPGDVSSVIMGQRETSDADGQAQLSQGVAADQRSHPGAG
jgi:hypothetical protein